MAHEVNHHPRIATAPSVYVVWTLLLISALINMRFATSDIVLQVQFSLFDLVLLALTAWGLYKGWLSWLPPRMLFFGAAVVSLIVFHSLFVWFTVDHVQNLLLAKDTVKAVAIVVIFMMLLTLFQEPSMTNAPVPIIIGVLVLTMFAGLANAYVYAYAPEYASLLHNSQTVYVVALTCLLLLLSDRLDWVGQTRNLTIVVFAALCVMLTGSAIYSKSGSGTTLAIMLWFIAARQVTVFKLRYFPYGLVLLIMVFAIGSILAINFSNINPMPGTIDTLQRSITVRFDLWLLALDKLHETFPVGIGLGQYFKAVLADPGLASESHRYVHNSFIGISAELGLIGILFCAGIVLLLWRASLGWHWSSLPIFTIVLLPPILIHDGHSIRILLLVTAVGFARFLQQRQDELSRDT